MKYRLMKFPLIHLLLLYFILLSEKMYFTAKILNMYIISMGLTSMYAEAYLEPNWTSMVELLCENHKKRFIADAWLGSKYVSGIGFTVEKVYRSHYLSDTAKVGFKNSSLRSCFSN